MEDLNRVRVRKQIRRGPRARRLSLVTAVFLVPALSLSLMAGSLAGPADPKIAGAQQGQRPNVLVIMTDDQRHDLTAMPSTRRLLRDRGREFTNAFAATPNCCPSRGTVFTGRYSHNHGVKNNNLAYELDQSTTLQRYLDDEGYRTAIFGKYMNGWDVQDDPPYFDRWSIYAFGTGIYYGGTYSVNGEMKEIQQYGTDYLSDEAVDFLEDSETSDDDPWLMYLTPNAPHHPAQPARKYENAEVPRWKGNPAVFEKDRSDKPRYVRAQSFSLRKGKRFRRKQLRSLMSVDDLVGRVAKKLRQLDESRDTIVIFTSDNGYFWGEHRLAEKWLPYEQSVHIPLIIRWPGVLPADSTDKRLVVNVDIAPTVLDALGIEQDPSVPMDGRSLLDDSWNRSSVLLEYGRENHHRDDIDVGTWTGLRSKHAAYTEYYNRSGEVTFREYYNLDKDPWEMNNLLRDGNPANDAPAEDLAAQLETAKNCMGSACP